MHTGIDKIWNQVCFLLFGISFSVRGPRTERKILSHSMAIQINGVPFKQISQNCSNILFQNCNKSSHFLTHLTIFRTVFSRTKSTPHLPKICSSTSFKVDPLYTKSLHLILWSPNFRPFLVNFSCSKNLVEDAVLQSPLGIIFIYIEAWPGVKKYTEAFSKSFSITIFVTL